MPIENSSPMEKIKEFKRHLVRLVNSPPLNYYTPKIISFWAKYGFKIKILMISIFVFLILYLGISLGRSLSKTATVPQYEPPPLPTIVAPSIVPIKSEFFALKETIKSFSTLLPDPAPPTIDEEISLSKSLKE